jgi:hypothetical protein
MIKAIRVKHTHLINKQQHLKKNIFCDLIVSLMGEELLLGEQNFQTESEANPDSYSIGNVGSFAGKKRPGTEADQSL